MTDASPSHDQKSYEDCYARLKTTLPAIKFEAAKTLNPKECQSVAVLERFLGLAEDRRSAKNNPKSC